MDAGPNISPDGLPGECDGLRRDHQGPTVDNVVDSTMLSGDDGVDNLIGPEGCHAPSLPSFWALTQQLR